MLPETSISKLKFSNFSCKLLNSNARTIFLTEGQNNFGNKIPFLKWHPIIDDFYSTDFDRVVVGFGSKGMPGRMCKVVNLLPKL